MIKALRAAQSSTAQYKRFSCFISPSLGEAGAVTQISQLLSNAPRARRRGASPAAAWSRGARNILRISVPGSGTPDSAWPQVAHHFSHFCCISGVLQGRRIRPRTSSLSQGRAARQSPVQAHRRKRCRPQRLPRAQATNSLPAAGVKRQPNVFDCSQEFCYENIK